MYTLSISFLSVIKQIHIIYSETAYYVFPKARVAAVVYGFLSPSVDLNKNTEKRMITYAFLQNVCISYDVVHFHDAPYSFCCQFDGRGGDQQRLDHILLQYVCYSTPHEVEVGSIENNLS